MNPIRLLSTLLCALAMIACPAIAGSLDAVPTAQIKRHAAEIDRLIEADLKAANLKPNADADDATFLRRVTLTIAGRIPTGTEIEAFLKSREPAKRQQAIDRLLDSTGYESHMYHWTADLLRAVTRTKEGGDLRRLPQRFDRQKQTV